MCDVAYEYELEAKIENLNLEIEALKVKNGKHERVIAATADYARAFWTKANERHDTRALVAPFKDLEGTLRSHLITTADKLELDIGK